MPASRKVTKEGLTIKEKLFCAEYVADPDFNATEACIKAGYSARSAKVKASQLLDKPAIQEEIERLTNSMMYRIGVTALGVAVELRKIAYSNALDYGFVDQEGEFVVNLKESTRAQMAAVAEITTETWTEGKGEEKSTHRRTKLKLAPKTPALEILGRKFERFSQKHEIAGKNGGPVKFLLERIPVRPEKTDAQNKASA
jgi:phage terminase small subunit